MRGKPGRRPGGGNEVGIADSDQLAYSAGQRLLPILCLFVCFTICAIFDGRDFPTVCVFLQRVLFTGD